MGLDYVELVISVEETFGVAIEDSEAASVGTTGQLLALVMSKLQSGTAGGCLTSHVFYRLRSALVKVTGLPRRSVTPGTATESLWPPEKRRAAWKNVAREVGVDLPPLRRPSWCEWSAMAIALVGAFAAATVVTNWIGQRTLSWFLTTTIASAIMLAWAVTLATRPAARYLPPGTDTVGGLARQMLAMNFSSFAADAQRWSEAEVWDALQNLIVRQLGVEREEVTKEARFVEDLGMG